LSAGLLNEYETMLNVGLGATALCAFTRAFLSAEQSPKAPVTLWHLATVLPLVFNYASRTAISKRQLRSGLRSTLSRDKDNNIGQNEMIFNLNQRVRMIYPRTARSFNCALSWGLLHVDDGAILSGKGPPASDFEGEAKEIIKAAAKLGSWAGQLTSFEYFTVLGVEFY
jgi:hypothetical protein